MLLSTQDRQDITDAMTMMLEIHKDQYRKNSRVGRNVIPYASHPMAVGSLLLASGGDRDEVIAGLLHDAIEDGGEYWAAQIKMRFGERPLALIREASEPGVDGKASKQHFATKEEQRQDWRRRKEGYVQHVSTASLSGCRLSVVDRWYNDFDLEMLYERDGNAAFDAFSVGKEDQAWFRQAYCTSLANRLSQFQPDSRVDMAYVYLHKLAAIDEGLFGQAVFE